MSTTHPNSMTPEEQIAFVRDLTASILASVEYKINAGEVPASWDGVELRWYLSERFTSHFGSTRQRRHEFKNAMTISNL